MSLRPVNFSEDAARQIQDTVRDYLGRTQHSRVDVDRTALQDDGNSNSGLLLGKIQTDFSASGTQISVKTCDAAGTESGSAFNVYLKPDKSAFDPTAVTVANTAATATCKLAAGTRIEYAFSGADAYMLGDIEQVCKDLWIDGTTGKFVYAIYWRVGQAVSTVSNVNGPDTTESLPISCNQPGS
jgi:hypothetical protein